MKRLECVSVLKSYVKARLIHIRAESLVCGALTRRVFVADHPSVDENDAEWASEQEEVVHLEPNPRLVAVGARKPSQNGLRRRTFV